MGPGAGVWTPRYKQAHAHITHLYTHTPIPTHAHRHLYTYSRKHADKYTQPNTSAHYTHHHSPHTPSLSIHTITLHTHHHSQHTPSLATHTITRYTHHRSPHTPSLATHTITHHTHHHLPHLPLTACFSYAVLTPISQIIIKLLNATIYIYIYIYKYVLGCIVDFPRPILLSANNLSVIICYICVGNVIVDVSACEKYLVVMSRYSK